jgi:hypothetical protein
MSTGIEESLKSAKFRQKQHKTTHQQPKTNSNREKRIH